MAIKINQSKFDVDTPSNTVQQEVDLDLENVFWQDEDYNEVQSELYYLQLSLKLLPLKFILNPVRLFVIRILNSYFRYPASELRKMLNIPWGTFNDHLEALKKRGLIESQREFDNHCPRNIIYLTSNGASEYSKLESILQCIIDPLQTSRYCDKIRRT